MGGTQEGREDGRNRGREGGRAELRKEGGTKLERNKIIAELVGVGPGIAVRQSGREAAGRGGWNTNGYMHVFMPRIISTCDSIDRGKVKSVINLRKSNLLCTPYIAAGYKTIQIYI